jgi:hypothetical protein
VQKSETSKAIDGQEKRGECVGISDVCGDQTRRVQQREMRPAEKPSFFLRSLVSRRLGITFPGTEYNV